MMEKKKTAKLDMWQRRLADSRGAYSGESGKMDSRERLYGGDRSVTPLVPRDTGPDGRHRQTSHVRNIIFENIESQVNSSIPAPKVTPRRKKDEKLAETIEHFLRNELDRLPFEMINDMAERTVPLHGGVGYLIEWDNERRTHDTVGEAVVSLIHPKQFAPQPGVYTGVEDMDWFIVKMPSTKASIKRKYGVSVYLEGESEPELRSPDGEAVNDDAVTQYIGYEKNDSGGIDRYSWVNDVELEDLKNYQARRQPVCAKCGKVRPLPGQIIGNNVQGMDTPDERPGLSESDIAGRMMAAQLAAEQSPEPGQGGALARIDVHAGESPGLDGEKYRGGACPWCGSEDFISREQDFEQVMLPIRTAGGVEIEGARPGFDENGMPVMVPTLIPFYRPDSFPIILQRSVSVHGQLLGNSDADQIADQQNTINRLEQKILDRLIKAGSRITLPDRPELRTDPIDGDRWFLKDPSEKNMIDVLTFSGDLQYELMHLNNVYEEARQILGITDSFQGRRDTTAQSGKAKEFSAAQAAGRLESKRVMKDAAYAAIFELMFKFWLAYGDEPRPVVYKNDRGENEYEEFNRYDFLEQDESGAWFWNDQFLFSCDTSAPLANNREAMWQETRMNLQTGAFGDPVQTETLILFWAKMEELHYPGAGSTKKFLEEKMAREAQQAQQMQQMQMQQQAAQTMPPGGPLLQGAPNVPPELMQAIDEQARAAAMRDSGGSARGR